LKIYLTRFVWDGKEYGGPNIHAETIEVAEAIAELNGLTVEGELTDIVGMEKDKARVIH